MNKGNGNVTGNKLSDQVVATDMLILAKTGVKTYASAITEAINSDVRKILKKQLDESILFQEQLSALMIDKGWYSVESLDEQIRKNIKLSQNTIDHIGNPQ
ncbi:MAG: spore coat protein [Clostridiales bacterium]|nr:spore coat protein [Clostridiales bacterium]